MNTYLIIQTYSSLNLFNNSLTYEESLHVFTKLNTIQSTGSCAQKMQNLCLRETGDGEISYIILYFSHMQRFYS